MFAGLTLEIRSAEGKSLAALVDEYLKQYEELPVDIHREPYVVG